MKIIFFHENGFNENVTKIFTLIIFFQLQRFVFIEKNFRKKYLRMKIIPREKKIP